MIAAEMFMKSAKFHSFPSWKFNVRTKYSTVHIYNKLNALFETSSARLSGTKVW
jgi:hypothetical protein